MGLKKTFLAAAVASIASQAAADAKLKCWSGWDEAGLKKFGTDTNGCGVTKSDKTAIKTAFGDKYKNQYTHECGGHLKAGHATWVKLTKKQCKEAGGFLIEGKGKDKKVTKL